MGSFNTKIDAFIRMFEGKYTNFIKVKFFHFLKELNKYFHKRFDNTTKVRFLKEKKKEKCILKLSQQVSNAVIVMTSVNQKYIETIIFIVIFD